MRIRLILITIIALVTASVFISAVNGQGVIENGQPVCAGPYTESCGPDGQTRNVTCGPNGEFITGPCEGGTSGEDTPECPVATVWNGTECRGTAEGTSKETEAQDPEVGAGETVAPREDEPRVISRQEGNERRVSTGGGGGGTQPQASPVPTPPEVPECEANEGLCWIVSYDNRCGTPTPFCETEERCLGAETGDTHYWGNEPEQCVGAAESTVEAQVTNDICRSNCVGNGVRSIYSSIPNLQNNSIACGYSIEGSEHPGVVVFDLQGNPINGTSCEVPTLVTQAEIDAWIPADVEASSCTYQGSFVIGCDQNGGPVFNTAGVWNFGENYVIYTSNGVYSEATLNPGCGDITVIRPLPNYCAENTITNTPNPTAAPAQTPAPSTTPPGATPTVAQSECIRDYESNGWCYASDGYIYNYISSNGTYTQARCDEDGNFDDSTPGFTVGAVPSECHDAGETSDTVISEVLGAEDSRQTLDSGIYEITGSNSGTVRITINEDNVRVGYFIDENGDGIKQDNEPEIDSRLVNVQISKTQDITNYDLNIGWNLIAFDLISGAWQKASSLMDEFDRQKVYVTHISTYTDGKWQTYSRRENDQGELVDFGEDFWIIPGKSYFVKSQVNKTAILTGNKFAESVQLDLSNGWNLVSIQSQNSYTAESLLNRCVAGGIQCDSVARFDSGLYDIVVSQNGTFFGNDFNIIKKSGYFLRVSGGGGQRLTP